MAASTSATTGAGRTRASRSPISRRQVETVLTRSTAVFALIFGAQALPFVFAQSRLMNPAWTIPAVGLIFLSLAAAVVASIIKRGRNVVNGAVAVLWFLAMATWPLGLVAGGPGVDTRPWPWYLCTVATSAAALAWPLRAAVPALVIAPLTYGVVRVAPAGGGGRIDFAIYDLVYAILLGGAVLIIMTMLRQAAAALDTVQSHALGRYTEAVRQQKTDLERVRVDAIVHDSVLATLSSAARASTPEAKMLASAMAESAITHLREASALSPGGADLVRVIDLADRIRSAADALTGTFEYRSIDQGDAEVTAHAAEAVYSAAAQAMVNSAEHAGGDAERWVVVEGDPTGGITVTVGDSGSGFDPEGIAPERIGVRVSILERMASAGGHATVVSAAGAGTVVTIRWPAVAP